MVDSVEDQRNREPPIGDDEDEEPSNGEDYEDDDGDFEEEEKEEETVSQKFGTLWQRAEMEELFRRIAAEGVPLRVHEVLIKGNTKTKDRLIAAETEILKNASTLHELLQAATIANAKLRRLEVFDSINITLDSGPPELPGTANVIVEVVETKSPLTGEIGIFSKPEARYWYLKGSLKLKNLFGFGELWNGSLTCDWDQILEVGAGISLHGSKGLVSAIVAQVSLLSQDWLKFSSYKDGALGLSLGLISARNHDLACNLSWLNLADPSQVACRSVRRQIGHGLSSSLKYTYKIDNRNSHLRPTRGYAFVSTSQIGGLVPDYHSLWFLRQEFDLCYAFPLGLYHAALNLGVSCRAIFPWGSGFLNMPSPLTNRFFLGGNSSPVCTLSGPAAFLGLKTRGLGPTEPQGQNRENSNDDSSETFSGRDFLGGDLALTAFADLSFGLPFKALQEAGVHGHVFACAGSLTKVTENSYRDFSFVKFCDSFRSSTGFGIIIPTRLFRMAVNYCYILRQPEHDNGRTGIQFSFSSPL